MIGVTGTMSIKIGLAVPFGPDTVTFRGPTGAVPVTDKEIEGLWSLHDPDWVTPAPPSTTAVSPHIRSVPVSAILVCLGWNCPTRNAVVGCKRVMRGGGATRIVLAFLFPRVVVTVTERSPNSASAAVVNVTD